MLRQPGVLLHTRMPSCSVGSAHCPGSSEPAQRRAVTFVRPCAAWAT